MIDYCIAEYQSWRPSDGLGKAAFAFDLDDREGMWRPGITRTGVEGTFVEPSTSRTIW